MWQELWQDHYTETYWFYYNSFTTWLASTGGHVDDKMGDAYFADSGQDSEMVFCTEFVLVPSADQQNEGEGRVDSVGSPLISI